MVGVSVTFAVTSGGGTVSGSTVTTNASGVATVGGWTLGTTAGTNSLTATAGSLPSVVFIATGAAGAAASVAKTSGDAQTATAGSAVSVAPSVTVRDANNNPVAGVAVTFAVASGGGSVTGATQSTNAAGVATIGAWTLGTTAGPNTLSVTVAGVAGVTFTATGVAGPAASLAKTAGDNQTALAGTAVPIAPAVTVRDANGNVVAGATVTFAVASGGGTITGGSATSNASGVATVGSWTLGSPGTNTLTASGAGVTVTFTATAQNPCSLSTTHVVGSTTTGQLSTLDCKLTTGEYIDFFSVTLNAANAYLFTQTSTAFDTYLYLLAADGTDIAENDDVGAGSNSSIKALLPSGSYLLGASSFDANATGAYSVASGTTSTAVTNCEDVFVVRGISTTQQLQTTDCQLLSGYYDDQYFIYLKAGQAVTISMNSTTVDSYLELYTEAGILVASNDDRAAGTNDSQIVFTPTTAGYFNISAGSFLAGQTGSYTLIIQ